MIKTLVSGQDGCPVKVEEHALLVRTVTHESYRQRNVFLVDNNGSPFLNVDGVASGATDGIHDGTDSVLWTGSAITGTWDFASTAQAKAGTKSIDATAVANGDQAVLTRASSISSTTYAVISGSIYLTKYSATKNNINLCWRLAGIADGVNVDLGAHINTATLNAWQDFQITLDDFSVTGDIDELLITIVSTGSTPQFYLDELDLRAGGGVEFSTDLESGTVFEYKWVDVYLTDAYTGITAVSGSSENATMVNLSYNKLLGVNQLANGITFSRTVLDAAITSGTIRNLSDMLQAGGRILTSFSDGTNTMCVVRIDLPEWVRIDERRGDNLRAVVNDDLTGLIDFKVNLVGREIV